MNAAMLDLLDSPDTLPEAIEEKLVGPDLLALVHELEAVHGSASPAAELTAPLLSRILSGGLVALSEDEFHAVISRPRTLLQLQKAVLLNGKEYWDEVVQRVRGDVAHLPMPVRPWYRSPWAWTANVLTGLAASIAFFVLWNTPSERLNDAERQLRDQAARSDALGQELAALKQSHPLVLPADLPEQDFVFTKTVDPPDLPENDPQDLPEAPKTKRSSV